MYMQKATSSASKATRTRSLPVSTVLSGCLVAVFEMHGEEGLDPRSKPGNIPYEVSPWIDPFPLASIPDTEDRIAS
jgi:hypothetical protein